MRRAVAIVVLAAAVAGCGGEDPLSPSEYRREATAICRDANRATRGITQPTRSTNEAIADYFARLGDVNKRTTARFADLEPPDELRDAHDDALSANRDGVAEVDRLVAELRRGGDAVGLLQGAPARLSEPVRRSREAATRLGVPECARSG